MSHKDVNMSSEFNHKVWYVHCISCVSCEHVQWIWVDYAQLLRAIIAVSRGSIELTQQIRTMNY